MTKDSDLLKLAAEKVMGATPVRERDTTRYKIHGSRDDLFLHDKTSPYIVKHEGWNPLTSDSDAFMLVDALQKRSGYFRLEGASGIWIADFRPGYEVGPDRRRVIVLACLRALGVRVEEED